MMMRPRLLFFLPLLLITTPQAVRSQANDEAAVRTAFSRFSRAFAEADTAILAKFLTEDYRHINGGSGSVLNRKSWLNWIASRREELDRGSLVITSYDVQEVSVQVYGNSAVLTGVVRSAGRRGSTSFSSVVRFTNVWIKQEGMWHRAAFHDSPLPQSD